ncbi:MAG: hypothetical protein AAFV90_06870 [Cyanobacteria bacterium J06634_5]
MKFPILSLSLFSLSALSISLLPAEAQAVCVGIDVPTQIAIHGENTEATQQSESHFEAAPGCFGSTTIHTGTQVYTGHGNIDQSQSNSHYLGGSDEQSGYASPYIDDEPLFFSVPTQVDLNVLPDPTLTDYYGTSNGNSDDIS